MDIDLEKIAADLVKSLETEATLSKARAEGVRLLYKMLRDEAEKQVALSINKES
jgi:hypothetical protein